MDYESLQYFAKKWNISERRVRILCSEGRIEGAKKIGRNWVIPREAKKPNDARKVKNYNLFIIGDHKELLVIDKKKQMIDKKRPFTPHMIKQLKEKLVVEWTYNTNAIEGNTLTLKETKVVLEGITIGGKSMKEHLETINHREAIDYIEHLVKQNTPLTEFNIKSIHNLILRNIDNANAGKYRSENVIISGASHRPPNHIIVPDEMEKLIKAYNSEWINSHPIIRAGLLHGEFVKIHPFIDGSGRTAQLLLNFELIKSGYLPIIIKNENRVSYCEALDKAHTKHDYSDFLKMIIDLEIEMVNIYSDILDL